MVIIESFLIHSTFTSNTVLLNKQTNYKQIHIINQFNNNYKQKGLGAVYFVTF